MEETVKIHPWHIFVLIPARNEEALIPRCLRSVLKARADLPREVVCDVVVAVDSSTDRTLDVAKSFLKHAGVVISTQAGVVGKARALAAEVALARYAGPLERCWLANTDADSVVSKDWLTRYIHLAEQGVEAVAGTVWVDSFEEHDKEVPGRFRSSYLIHADGTHPHVHGANFGVRADTYSLAGRWHDLPTAEDHDLWNRIGAIGAARRSVSDTPVVTSGRRKGRAPRGFADALAAHNETAA